MGDFPERGHNSRDLLRDNPETDTAAEGLETGEKCVPELQHVIDEIVRQAPDFEGNPVINKSNDDWVLQLGKHVISGGPHKGQLKTVIWMEHFEEPVSLLIMAAVNDRVDTLEMKAATADPENPVEVKGASPDNQRMAALELTDAARALGIPVAPLEVQLPD